VIASRSGAEIIFAIRQLEPKDAAELRDLRLLSLSESPDAFLSSYEEDARMTQSDHAERLESEDPAHRVLGAFDGGRLVGMVGFYRERHRKAAHKAHIWGMYVEPSSRGKGTGRALIEAAIDFLRQAPGIEQVNLEVSTSQTRARALYVSVGFESIGVERRAMKDGDRYIDEEHMVLFTAEPPRSS
jgi:RimJ/RimL family protein N-acetyltransferase